MNKILVGCDPEVFVKKNGSFISAYNLIPGTKKNPFKVHNGAVQVDGMALEFNIDPAKSQQEFLQNVLSVYSQLKSMVDGLEVVATPVATFTPEYMKEQPEEAIELGCDPDFNAWTSQANPKPDGDRPFRTASGHVHIGWTEDADIHNPNHLGSCETVAKQMDLYLGLPSLFYDDDTKRRELYGKAGCYRPKSYGVEYRTLSNRWLSSEKLISWVYNQVQLGMDKLMSGKANFDKYGNLEDIINNSKKDEAMAILKAEKIEVPQYV